MDLNNNLLTSYLIKCYPWYFFEGVWEEINP